MILQPCNVELTKIYYYDKNKTVERLPISTISKEVCQNNFNRNVIIKRNIFGHKWVLKINENVDDVKKKSKLRVVVYVLVFCSIVVAICFGIFFSFEKYSLVPGPNTQHNSNISREKIKDFNLDTNISTTIISKTDDKHQKLPYEKTKNFTTIINDQQITITNSSFCNNCSTTAICFKLKETEKPTCINAVDFNDPTGCGGLCKINTHFCQILDYKPRVHQCSLLKNILKCQSGRFSCGNMCILASKRCDGVLDCSNGSDEENCVCDLRTSFQCGKATSCLSKTKKCNQIIDCWDKSDEENCTKVSNCSKEEFPCYNGQCILQEQFCNGHVDCDDNTDEPEGCQI